LDLGKDEYSHRKPSSHIGGIPKADIACILPTIGRVPRHNQEIQRDEDVENDCNIPDTKGCAREVGTLPSPPHDVETDGHDEGEEGGRIYLEVDDCGKCERDDKDNCLDGRDILKLKASPAGGARIIMIVRTHFSR
jgi:hypothetical protein